MQVDLAAYKVKGLKTKWFLRPCNADTGQTGSQGQENSKHSNDILDLIA